MAGAETFSPHSPLGLEKNVWAGYVVGRGTANKMAPPIATSTPTITIRGRIAEPGRRRSSSPMDLPSTDGAPPAVPSSTARHSGGGAPLRGSIGPRIGSAVASPEERRYGRELPRGAPTQHSP